MKRTTVKISDELDAKLRHEAARRGVTISEVTREALDLYFNGGIRRRTFLSAGAGASGESDIAERMEEILREEWSDPRRL
jgi:predicted transcriptional regulator